MMKMTWRGVLFWYDIYELQTTEEEIVLEYKNKEKKIPDSETLREIVNERIQERREKINGSN